MEVWRSDGTLAGTERVKDILPGSGNAFDAPPWIRSFAAVGSTLFFSASDGSTGRELWKSEPAGDPKQGYAFTHAPLVVKDKVIAGSAGGEFGVRGFIAAWDVKTGKEVWRFNTVPGPGEAGNESWSGESWKNGGAPIWVTGSYDPDTNLTYWGTGNPGPDWDGAGRLGDNLYSCSVIAIDPLLRKSR